MADRASPDHAGRGHGFRGARKRDFVESVLKAAETLGMSQAFVGFIVVALVGAAAEMAVAFFRGVQAGLT